METKNNVVENKEIKTLNQLLNRIHCRIKKDKLYSKYFGS